jgi:hypothetical protein
MQTSVQTTNFVLQLFSSELPFASVLTPANTGSLDFAGSFASERSCFARDDREGEGTFDAALKGRVSTVAHLRGMPPFEKARRVGSWHRRYRACSYLNSVILSGVDGLACESIHVVERPRVCMRAGRTRRGIFGANSRVRVSCREFPFAPVLARANSGSLDSAGSFASERSCYARDDREGEGHLTRP